MIFHCNTKNKRKKKLLEIRKQILSIKILILIQNVKSKLGITAVFANRSPRFQVLVTCHTLFTFTLCNNIHFEFYKKFS